MSKFTPEFIEETAREFGLDEAELTNVLITAEEEHDCHQFVDDGRGFHRECAENFRKIRKALDKAVAEIQECPDNELKELEFFRTYSHEKEIGKASGTIVDQLFYLADLFAEFDETYKANWGRPTELEALEEFGSHLSELWLEQTGERFGQDFQPEFEDGKADAKVGILQPKSQAARFFCACAKQLDKRYKHEQCRTVMINLGKGCPQGFSKLAQK